MLFYLATSILQQLQKNSFILFAFWCVTLADIVKEHSLHRDGPISSVKLFSLTSCKTEAIDGKKHFSIYSYGDFSSNF